MPGDFKVFLYTFLSVISIFLAVVVTGAIYIWWLNIGSIQLGDGVPGAFDDSEQFLEEEEDALEIMDDRSRQSYLMAKRWIEHNPPNSGDTDISLSQYMTIQEKAVAAWEFTYDVLQQPFVTVRNRTELDFRGSDDICCVQTNLPLPKQKSVYYWEVKIYEMEPDTKIAVGLTTKPYPMFRMPGMHRYSVAYDSTGHRRLNQPFTCPTYGRKWQTGDVIGVGYRTRTGEIFFTHNGKKLDDVVRGMRVNLFPTVGANGPANVYVNLGQDGFVFIQANVKEWGLAPAQGSLAPPPAYGDQQDSLLLDITTTAAVGGVPAGNVAGPSNSYPQEPEAPPYVRRRSNDDAHDSLNNASIHTPPGSPPPQLPAAPQNASTTIEESEQSSESNSTYISETTSTSPTTSEPSSEPTSESSSESSSEPTGEPTGEPSSGPTGEPSSESSSEPTSGPLRTDHVPDNSVGRDSPVATPVATPVVTPVVTPEDSSADSSQDSPAGSHSPSKDTSNAPNSSHSSLQYKSHEPSDTPSHDTKLSDDH